MDSHVSAKNEWKVLVLLIGIVIAGFGLSKFLHKSKVAGNIEDKPVIVSKSELKDVKKSEVTSATEDGESKNSKLVAEESSLNLEKVSKALEDPEVGNRIYAILQLRKHPSEEGIKLLVRFLKDMDGTVVAEAIDALGNIGVSNDRYRESILKILEEKAKDKKFFARGDALVTAAIVGKNDVLPLISSFISKDNEVDNFSAARALALIGDPSCIPLLSELLAKSKEPKVRQNAFETLANIGSQEAADVLENYVLSAKGEDQAAACMALSRIDNPETKKMLIYSVQNEKLEMQSVYALARSPGAPEIFGGVLQDDNMSKDQKIELLKVLSNYGIYGTGETRSGIVDAIAPLLNDANNDVKLEAMKTIAHLGGDEVADIAAEQLKSGDPKVREAAVMAYGTRVTPDNYKILLDMIWDKDEKVRRTAMVFSSRFVNSSDREILEKAAHHEDKFIHEFAEKLLDSIPQ